MRKRSFFFRRTGGVLLSLSLLLGCWGGVTVSAEGDINLAEGASATATYYENDYQNNNVSPPENAIDGDLATRWSSYGSTLPQALQIDLRAVCRLSAVESYWFHSKRISTYDLIFSNTPTIIDSVFSQPTDATHLTGLQAQGSGEDGGKASTPARVTLDTPVSARYVTVYATGVEGIEGTALNDKQKNTAAIWEVAVYGQPASLDSPLASLAPVEGQRVAFGTPVTDLSLPAVLPATLDNQREVSLPIMWNTENYQSNTAGTYTLIGKPDLSGFPAITNPRDLQVTATVTVLPEGYSTEGRQEYPLNTGWRFYKGSANASSPTFNDAAWAEVTLPHTWNALDGQDGGNNYYRGDGWYRRTLPWQEEFTDKSLFLEFQGANTQTTVYVNGQQATFHRGGYTAFRVPLTPYITPSEPIALAIKVNNAYTEEVAPLRADFTFYGGIYRELTLLALEPAGHVDALDHGAEGLYLTPTDVSADSADIQVEAALVNDTDTPQTLTVTAELRNPAKGSIEWIDTALLPDEWLPFDKASMTPGGSIATATETLTVEAGQAAAFTHTFTLQQPRLWDGLRDPYRYQVELVVRDADGKELDRLADFVGLRVDEVDAENGYFLNGRSYPLRGVNRHQDREDMGWAISATQHAEDFAMIYEMGANTIRLAHYPHADTFYEFCDMYGMVVWAEIPFVDQIGGGGSYEEPNATRKAFFETTREQLTELILQQRNRPSIVCWGLQNEIRFGSFEGVAQPFLAELDALAHSLDPTRFTTQAIYNATGSDTTGWTSDAVSWNLYAGWYYSSADKFGEDMDSRRRKDPTRPMGVSEYGFGANVLHHSETVTKPAVNDYDALQTEEYQAWAHEQAWAAIEQRPWLWATHVWNMFDFGVDNRNEAEYPGINNKGLVSHDRQTKKDAFYFYKANWSEQPVVHLNSSRFTQREADAIQIKAYSNLDSLTLTANGVTHSTLSQAELAQDTVFVWKNIPLKAGKNTVTVTGTRDGEAYTDTVVWQHGEEPYTLGDVDENGSVTAADALLALQIATHKIAPSDDQLFTANVDGSGEITANDALLILQKATKKIDSFPLKKE